jgi:hypothetical protein
MFAPIVVTPSIWITTAQTGPSSPTSGTSSPFQFKNNPLTSTTYRPDSRQIKLNFQQAQDLHNAFTRDKYRAWQRSAPQDWSDSFFRSRVPLIIASRYGQDEPLKHFTPRAAQQLHERMRWDDLSSISFAIATNIKYFLSPTLLFLLY